MVETQKAWYVIFVGDPRRISYLDSAFKALHSEYLIWIPERPQLERNKRKNKIIEEPRPLYPGYAFVQFNFQHNTAINDLLKFHCGGRLLKRPGEKKPYILTSEEMETMKQLEQSKEDTRSLASSYKIKVGDAVDIVGGPFQGFKGDILSLKRDKVVVNLHIFERTVATDIDPASCVVIS
ncbi:MAG: transcription termination/antitermination NusG family protein [Thermodesulfobacteriota bacterium]